MKQQCKVLSTQLEELPQLCEPWHGPKPTQVQPPSKSEGPTLVSMSYPRNKELFSFQGSLFLVWSAVHPQDQAQTGVTLEQAVLQVTLHWNGSHSSPKEFPQNPTLLLSNAQLYFVDTVI